MTLISGVAGTAPLARAPPDSAGSSHCLSVASVRLCRSISMLSRCGGALHCLSTRHAARMVPPARGARCPTETDRLILSLQSLPATSSRLHVRWLASPHSFTPHLAQVLLHKLRADDTDEGRGGVVRHCLRERSTRRCV
jgi:hypothetical protein